MELYVIRHAQSVHNKYMKLAHKDPENIGFEKPATTDTELSDEGRTEAQNAIHTLSDFCDYMYVSPLKRTMETAQIIREAKFENIPIETTDLLKEVDHGETENMTLKEKEEKFGAEGVDEVLDFSKFGGESYASIRSRVEKFLELAKNSGHGRVIVVTSQGVIKMMYEIVVGSIAPSVPQYIRIKNAVVHTFIV